MSIWTKRQSTHSVLCVFQQEVNTIQWVAAVTFPLLSHRLHEVNLRTPQTHWWLESRLGAHWSVWKESSAVGVVTEMTGRVTQERGWWWLVFPSLCSHSWPSFAIQLHFIFFTGVFFFYFSFCDTINPSTDIIICSINNRIHDRRWLDWCI